eukprot:c17717_g1_i1.p1 GENE.c17717_g1_i1~~c17717_g1_i1.p1  ORF type:complete len:247 (-),score=37.72 c17717_g1_i1:163-903(-)
MGDAQMPSLRVFAFVFCFGVCVSVTIPDLCHPKPGSPCDSLCDHTGVIKYKKLDNFPVCIEIVSEFENGTQITHGRTVQYPRVDQFAELNMNWVGLNASNFGFDPRINTSVGLVRAYSTGVTNDKNSHNMIRSENSTKYFDPKGRKSNVALLFYTLLVHLDVGKPTELTWEVGDCSGCSDNDCVYGVACGTPITDSCGDLCKPKIYVAFTGTDEKGQILTSSGSMLTRFSAYGLTKTYHKLKSSVV